MISWPNIIPTQSTLVYLHGTNSITRESVKYNFMLECEMVKIDAINGFDYHQLHYDY